MVTASLQSDFYDAPAQSKSFKLLNLDEQNELKNSFETADDDQLARGLNVLKENMAKEEQLEIQIRARKETQIAMALEIKSLLYKINKGEAMAAEEQERQETAKRADELLGTMEQVDKKPRKKLFGIF